MKKVSLSIATALVFFVAVAVAQSNSPQPDQGTTPGAQSASPSPSQQGSSSTVGQGSMSQGAETKENKGEKKLKGCIRSDGGQYMLEEKHGKMVNLTGQDFSGHVGHEVAVRGSYESATPTATGSASSSGKTFNVTSVDMISETCPLGAKKDKSSSSTDQTHPPAYPQK